MNTGTSLRGTWHDAWVLAGHLGSQRWLALILIGFGLAAALAETLGIGLAVMLLFALLQQGDQLGQADGLISSLYSSISSVLGDGTGLLSLLFFTLILLNAILVFVNNVVTGAILNRMAERMRNLVHEVFVTVGYKHLQKRERGELLHTLATQSWTVSEAFYALSRIGVNLCAVLVFGAGIFALSWIIGITALIGAAGALLLTRLLLGPLRRLSQKTLAANRILTERMLISLSGMRTLRIYAQEDHMLKIFSKVSSDVRRLAIRSEVVKSLIGPLSQVINLGILLMIVLYATRVGTEISVIIAAVLLLLRLQPYIAEIETQRLALATLSASLRDVRQTLDRHDKPWPRDGTRIFSGFTTSLSFEDVAFSHDADGGTRMSDISFVIPHGQLTLIEGPSGSGKSTIFNLILRLYEPESGRITVDGIDLDTITRTSWLERVAIAGQDVELIEGTVLENIDLGQSSATFEQVRDVCAAVEILDDLERLPAGLDTRIGAGGSSFSGGQRQRLGLARALLRDPDILLLDEAMSALEADRETRILQRIKERMRGRTIVVVSHHLSPEHASHHLIQIADGRALKPELALSAMQN